MIQTFNQHFIFACVYDFNSYNNLYSGIWLIQKTANNDFGHLKIKKLHFDSFSINNLIYVLLIENIFNPLKKS